VADRRGPNALLGSRTRADRRTHRGKAGNGLRGRRHRAQSRRRSWSPPGVRTSGRAGARRGHGVARSALPLLPATRLSPPAGQHRGPPVPGSARAKNSVPAGSGRRSIYPFETNIRGPTCAAPVSARHLVRPGARRVANERVRLLLGSKLPPSARTS